MKAFPVVLLSGLFILLWACQSPTHNAPATGNPPAPGFNLNGSDKKAIAIADEVMEAMGGRKNWDDTRYLTWNFFNVRKHYWDKHTGNIRIESLKDSNIYLLNLNSMVGKVLYNGEILEGPDANEHLNKATEMWINDSYWLFMPFKLKDDGVTLKYSGEATTIGNRPADVLELTFDNVGVTPHNKYHIYVDKKNRLVSQWDYYQSANDEAPRFQLPWEDYKLYGKIKLSGSRGQRHIEDIAVLDKMPPELFTQF